MGLYAQYQHHSRCAKNKNKTRKSRVGHHILAAGYRLAALGSKVEKGGDYDVDAEATVFRHQAAAKNIIAEDKKAKGTYRGVKGHKEYAVPI